MDNVAMDVDEEGYRSVPVNFLPPNSNGSSPEESKIAISSARLGTPSHWVPAPITSDNYYLDEEGAWIHTCWDDSTTPLLLTNFLTRWPPSLTPESYCAWISVDRGGRKESHPDIQGLKRSYETLTASGNVNVASLDAISISHNVLVGKWLIFTDWKRIDALWGRVVQLVCMSRRHGCAKVSTRKEKTVKRVREDGNEVEEEQKHVICVYVDDYTNVAEVKALREALRGIGVKWKIGFKTDAYTDLGIYSKNDWGLRPTRYFS